MTNPSTLRLHSGEPLLRTGPVSEAKTGLLAATYHVDSYQLQLTHVDGRFAESRYAEERVRRMVNDKILEILSDGRTYTVTIAPNVEVRKDDYPPYPIIFTQYAYVWVDVGQCEVNEHVAPGTFPAHLSWCRVRDKRFVQLPHGWQRIA